MNFLRIGVDLAIRLHDGKRLRIDPVAAEFGVSRRTVYRWLSDLQQVLPIARILDGDGHAVYYIPRDMRRSLWAAEHDAKISVSVQRTVHCPMSGPVALTARS